jgi:hypothetical protein
MTKFKIGSKVRFKAENSELMILTVHNDKKIEMLPIERQHVRASC